MKDRGKENNQTKPPSGNKSPAKHLTVPAQTDSNFQTSADHSELEEIEKKRFEIPPNPAEPQASNFMQRTKWTLIMIPSFLPGRSYGPLLCDNSSDSSGDR